LFTVEVFPIFAAAASDDSGYGFVCFLLPVSGHPDGTPTWGDGRVLGVANCGDKLPSSVEIDLGSFVVDRPDSRHRKIGEADRYP